jgi:signal transduction histidine kinase
MATHRPTRNELLGDAAIAAAVFSASLGLLAVGDVDGVGVLLTALASLPLAARRFGPLPVFVFTALASTALQAYEHPVGPPIGPTVALYWVGAAGDGSRARMRGTLAVVGALLVAHVSATGLGEDGFPVVPILFGVVVWGAAWLAGDRTRLRHERMAELEERALRAEREAERERRLAAAEERTRIARDLHDSAGHAINVILVHAGLGRLRVESDPNAAREAFATIEEVARETVGDIDELVRVLRDDGSLSEDGAEVEPPPGLAALGTLVERHRDAGLDVTATVRGERRPLPAGVERCAYRILQEALTNAARHGDGGAEVDIDYGEDAVEVSVANGFSGDRPGGAGSGGHGIVGMRERAAILGGILEAGAQNGRFEVTARLPLAHGRA